jgi:hypothetical protein
MTRVTENIDFDPGQVYKLAISSLGFERRSSYLARRGLRADMNLCFAFDNVRVGAFAQNAEDLQARGLHIIDLPEDRFQPELREALTSSKPNRVAVDISSMTRRRLAAVVSELQMQGRTAGPLVADFYYSPAKFSPPHEDDVGVLEASPLPGFGGPLRRASLPVGAVLGLGYEPHRALGIIEYLEPSTAWIFSPVSSRDYESAVAEANRGVLALVQDEYRLTYEVADPAGTVNALDSLAFSAGESRRVVLVPMGPKIFALAALLVGLAGGEKRPAVWRVGEGLSRRPLVAEEEGHVIGLRVEFGAPEPEQLEASTRA